MRFVFPQGIVQILSFVNEPLIYSLYSLVFYFQDLNIFRNIFSLSFSLSVFLSLPISPSLSPSCTCYNTHRHFSDTFETIINNTLSGYGTLLPLHPVS